MHFKFFNVNSTFRGLVAGFQDGEYLDENMTLHTVPVRQQGSRNGPVLLIEEPCTITYLNPRQRVLFNQARDCNPFFHVFESLWMFAGRNDIAPLKTYISNYDFSDDGVHQNGAYGYRWRRSKTVTPGKAYPDDRGIPTYGEVDQLKVLAEHLKADPDSRRAVLQMWNVEDDLLKLGCLTCKSRATALHFTDPGPCPSCGASNGRPNLPSKDVCCNLSVMFSIRKVHEEVDTGGFDPQGQPISDGVTTNYLDMTVTNRSNDLIWGMLGANVVHFSFLQEYMAARLGVEVGVYNQFTNNLHVYCTRKDYKPAAWLADETPDAYVDQPINYVPLVQNADRFDQEVARFIDVDWTDANPLQPGWHGFLEPFLETVASPMCRAFAMHKDRDYSAAIYWCNEIKADDWRIACYNWIEKRRVGYESKKEVVE